MPHELFKAIEQFREWAGAYAEQPEDDRGGEWECDYNQWPKIWQLFKDFINDADPATWSDATISGLLYIIARDNDSGSLAGIAATNESVLTILTERVIASGPPDAKWQLAVRMAGITDRQQAEKLLVQLVQDDNEYVSRRALMSLAEIASDKTEHYCRIAWEKEVDEMQEYQRIAVLHALFRIQSGLLPHYLQLATKDGRKHLISNLRAIEAQLP